VTEQYTQSKARMSQVPYNVLRYVDIALILKQCLSFHCRFNEAL